MGSDSSTCSSNTPSKPQKTVRALEAPLKAETANDTEAAARIHQEYEARLRRMEDSLQRDMTTPNIVDEFSNLIEMEGFDKMACVQRIVQSMGSEWRNVMKDEAQITEVVGSKQMNKLKHTRAEYFRLLLETKNVVIGLLEESEIQRENVQDSLQVVNTAKEQGDAKLDEKDRLEFDESIVGLMKWIDQSELVEITKKWNELSRAMEAQKTIFQRYFEKLNCEEKTENRKKKQNFWLKWSVRFGALIGLAVGIGLVIGVAIGTAAGVVVSGIIMLPTALHAAGKFYYGYYVKPSPMAHKIQKICDMLNEYILYANKLQVEVSKMDASRKQIAKRIKFNPQTCKKLSRSLDRIDKYLCEFIGHGADVIMEIEKACEEFLK